MHAAAAAAVDVNPIVEIIIPKRPFRVHQARSVLEKNGMKEKMQWKVKNFSYFLLYADLTDVEYLIRREHYTYINWL